MKHSSRDLSFLSIPLLRIGGSFLMMIHGFSKMETLLSDEKIEFYNFGGQVSESPSGNPLTLPTVNVYVTFATDNGNEFIQNISAIEFNPINGYSAGAYINMNGGFAIGLRKIVFPKSYITFSIPVAIVTAYSFGFGIYYK
jgi:hypothetical protein